MAFLLSYLFTTAQEQGNKALIALNVKSNFLRHFLLLPGKVPISWKAVDLFRNMVLARGHHHPLSDRDEHAQEREEVHTTVAHFFLLSRVCCSIFSSSLSFFTYPFFLSFHFKMFSTSQKRVICQCDRDIVQGVWGTLVHNFGIFFPLYALTYKRENCTGHGHDY